MKISRILILLILILIPIIIIYRFQADMRTVKSDINEYVTQNKIVYTQNAISAYQVESIYEYCESRIKEYKNEDEFFSGLMTFNYEYSIWESFSSKAFYLRSYLETKDYDVNRTLERIKEANIRNDKVLASSLVKVLEKERNVDSDKNAEAVSLISDQAISFDDIQGSLKMGFMLYIFLYLHMWLFFIGTGKK